MGKKLKNICLLGCAAMFGVLSAVSAQAANQKKDWTFMVFINGHNNLDDFGAFNINQMESVGSTDKLNIVVQWASLNADTTKRMLVQKDNDTSKVTSPVVQELPPVDMGDKNQLFEFIKWTADTYPADHYFVAVWNHGSGWHLRQMREERARLGFAGGGFSTTDISSDDRTGHIITTEQLGQVMVDAAKYIGRKVDIVGADACLMAMAEVAHEMAGGIGTFVASEELEPGEGWPYDLFLQRWVAKPEADRNQVGAMLVEAFHEFYSKNGSDTTLSAVDMAAMPDMLDSVRALRAKLMSMPDLTEVKKAADSSARFFFTDYLDLGDAIANIRPVLSKTGEALPELERLSALMSKVVVANKTTGNMGKATGLAIWWPTSKGEYDSYITRYKGLRFDKDTGWTDFLAKLY